MQRQTAPHQHTTLPITTPGPRRVCRTINVIREVEGIAQEVHVNIAYDPAPGVTFSQAREFEYALEMKIQALLAELSNRPHRSMGSNLSYRFIPVNKAMEISGHHTKKAFTQWRYRHNGNHKSAQVIFRAGLVELQSLLTALGIKDEEETA